MALAREPRTVGGAATSLGARQHVSSIHLGQGLARALLTRAESPGLGDGVVRRALGN